MITVIAMSSGVRSAQGKVLGALYGVGTDITVTTESKPASGPGGSGQITPEPYVQHSDTFTSPTVGPLKASAVTAISRLRDVTATAGGLVLTEIRTTIPAGNAPPPPRFQPPIQTSVVGVDLSHRALGPLSAARLVKGRTFAAGQATADVTVVDSGYAAAHRLKVGNASHLVAVPFSAPVTVSAIVLAVILAIAGALVAGSFAGWQISRLRPAAALARVE